MNRLLLLMSISVLIVGFVAMAFVEELVLHVPKELLPIALGMPVGFSIAILVILLFHEE